MAQKKSNTPKAAPKPAKKQTYADSVVNPDLSPPEHPSRKEAIKAAKEQGFIGGIVIHCSGSNLPKHDNAATIDAWHKRRGWKGIGYHWFIRRDGKLETGRPIDSDPYLDKDEQGAHVLGHNLDYLGVCLHGLQASDYTPAQFATLKDLIQNQVLTKNKDAEILGHNYFTDKKTCPCFNWVAWVTKNFPNNLPLDVPARCTARYEKG